MPEGRYPVGRDRVLGQREQDSANRDERGDQSNGDSCVGEADLPTEIGNVLGSLAAAIPMHSSGHLLAGLQQVVAVGARMLIHNPVFDEMEHLEIFASEIASTL